MFEFSTVVVDLAKNVVQVHGVDADGKAILRRHLRPLIAAMNQKSFCNRAWFCKELAPEGACFCP